MVTLCIRYVIDPHKHADFETYARHWPAPIKRCAGKFVGYFLPTKIAGATNTAPSLIDSPSVATDEPYRGALGDGSQAQDHIAHLERPGYSVSEKRSLLECVSKATG